MLLSIIQQSSYYTHLHNCRKVSAFEPISNQLHFLMSYNLSFTRSLSASYLEMDGLSSVD